MELSERAIQALEKAGCTSIYEEDWSPRAKIDLRALETPLYIRITEGSLVPMQAEQEVVYQAGDHFCLPAHQSTSLKVGENGCRAVLGE